MVKDKFKPAVTKIIKYTPDINIIPYLMEPGTCIIFSVYNYLEALISHGFVPFHGSYYLKYDDKILFLTLFTPYYGRTDSAYVYSKIILKNEQATLDLMDKKKSAYSNDLQFPYRPEYYYDLDIPTKEFFHLTTDLEFKSYEAYYAMDKDSMIEYKYLPFTGYVVEKISIKDSHNVKLNDIVFRNSKLESFEIALNDAYTFIDLDGDLYQSLFTNDLSLSNIIYFWHNADNIKDVLEMEYFK